MALRLSLPVFVEPAIRVAPHIDWRIERDADGVWLVAVNDGARHERLHDILLSAGAATFKPEGESSPYLLAGVTRRFRLPVDAVLPNAAELRLTAQSDSGKIDVLVHSPQQAMMRNAGAAIMIALASALWAKPAAAGDAAGQTQRPPFPRGPICGESSAPYAARSLH